MIALLDTIPKIPVLKNCLGETSMLAVVSYFGILGAFTVLALVLYFGFRAIKLI
jgi:hypothetical protein